MRSEPEESEARSPEDKSTAHADPIGQLGGHKDPTHETAESKATKPPPPRERDDAGLIKKAEERAKEKRERESTKQRRWQSRPRKKAVKRAEARPCKYCGAPIVCLPTTKHKKGMQTRFAPYNKGNARPHRCRHG